MSKLKTSALAFLPFILGNSGPEVRRAGYPIAPLLHVAFFTIAPYVLNFWWKFLPSIVFIILLIRFKHPEYLTILGLQMSGMQGVIASCVFVTTVAVANFLVPPLLMKEAIFLYKGDLWHTGWALMPFSQALLEELVLRALLITACARFFKSERFVCGFGAILFMVWHIAFFPLMQNVWLSGKTLTSLFLFAYAANNLFFTYRNIGVPMAVHSGWNLVKFNGEYIGLQTFEAVPEGYAFNAVEGSTKIVVLALTLAVVSELLNLKNRTKFRKQTMS